MSALEKAPQSVDHPARRPGALLKSFLRSNRRPLSALVFFIVLLAIFTLANPTLFLNPRIYNAVFVSLPIPIILVVPLVPTVVCSVRIASLPIATLFARPPVMLGVASVHEVL